MEQKETVTRASSSFDSTDEFILRESKKRFPSTAADATPGQSQDNTRGTALYATAGPSTVPLSTKDNKDSDPAAFYDREKGVELSGSTVGGLLDVSPSSSSEWKYCQMQCLRSSCDTPPTSSESICNSDGEPSTPAESLSDIFFQSAKRIPLMTADTDSSDSDSDTSERSKMKSAVKHKRKSKSHSSRRKKKRKKSPPSVAFSVDSSDYTLDRPPPGPLRETVMETPSTAADAPPGHSQDNTRETELHATAGPSSLQHFMDLDDSLSDTQKSFDLIRDQDCNSHSCSSAFYTERGENRSEIMSVQSENTSGAESDAQMEMDTSLTAVKSSVTNTWPTESAGPSTLQQLHIRVQSPAELSDLDPELELLDDQKIFTEDDLVSSYSSAFHIAGSGENFNDKSQPSECEAGGDSDPLVKMEAPVTAVKSSVTNTQPTRPHLQLSSDPGRSQRGSSCLHRSHSVPSLSQISSAENKTLRPSESLSDLLLKSGFEEFTPDVTVDENDETYRFLCSCPGLQKCSMTFYKNKTFSEEGVHDTSAPSRSPSSASSIVRPHNYNRRDIVRIHLHGSQPPPRTQRRKKSISSAQSRHTTRIKRKLSGLSYKQSLNSWSPVCSSISEVEVVEKGNRSTPERVSEHGSSSTSSPLFASDKLPNRNVSRNPGNSSSSILSANDDESSPESRIRPDRLNKPTQLQDKLDSFSYPGQRGEQSLSPVCSSKTKDETEVLSASQCDTDREGPVLLVPLSEEPLSADDLNLMFELLSVQPESTSAGDSDALVKMEAPVTAVKSSVTNTQPTRPHLQLSSDPGRSQRGSSCLPRSHSVPSLSQISSAENKTFRPSESLPDLLLKSSFEEFTPDVTVDENDETYRFLCSCPGLYQCSVTGLVFHMEGEGHMVYRVVSWDRRLLAQHHKKPAGPLFDIKCLQQSVCRLHLPHCEIRSTAGCGFLSVAHVKDESIEFIPPHKITETHVIINITGFSGFGNVKDEDSPPEPVRALVLLFYRPPDDQDLESLLNVLMLPGNAVLRNVRRTRKINVGDELYIETSSHCKLLPKQEYTLSTCPEDDSVLVQPTTAEFYCDNYDNYFTSFQVDLEKILKHIKLFLRDTNRHSVWERRVCLSSAGLKKSCGQSALNLPPNKKLFDVRSSFIEGISGPVLKSLLDKLLEKKVLTDPERESVDEMQNKRDKARFVIDTVRKKGEAASSEMIEILCELDPFLCEHLGLV